MTATTSSPPIAREIQVTEMKVVIAVCIIGNVRDRIICVVEGQNKAWKKRGQTSVVFETLHEDEAAEIGAHRSIQEELDIPASDIHTMQKRGAMHFIIEDETSLIHAHADVFLVQFKTGTRVKKVIHGGELLSRGMIDLVKLKEMKEHDLRPGTKEALRIALEEGANASITLRVKGGLRV